MSQLYGLRDFEFTGNELHAEASTLELNLMPNLIHVKSEYTGKFASFKHNDTVIDADGDIQYFVYVPVEDLPKVKRMIIWND